VAHLLVEIFDEGWLGWTLGKREHDTRVSSGGEMAHAKERDGAA
jgi:hypothetical protein